MFPRRPVPRWPGYPGQRGHRVSPGAEGWPETRAPWYLRPFTWDWRGSSAQGAAAGLVIAFLVLGLAGLGYAVWQTDPATPCTVVVYAQGSNITSYTETPHGCATILPGTFAP